ncbi:MAG: FtsX-like permease family protein [Paramuribaculum sp.]|nr:FtsX-like permease family protein [Paramuribaculum sp.]
MKRNLLQQMRNEWRSNVWMTLELTIVSLILWFLFSSLWSLFNVRLLHKGYDVDDLYATKIKIVDSQSSLYEPYDSLHSPFTDLELLISNLRENPNIEVIGVGRNIITYNYNYYGTELSYDTLTYPGNLRQLSPDVIRAYKLGAPDGTTTDQLAGIIERGDLIISKSDYDDNDAYNPEPFIGKDVILGRDSSCVRHIAAEAYGLRRADYEPQRGVIYAPLSTNDWPEQMIIRIVIGRDKEFLESLTPANKRIGNVYLPEIKSLASYREIAHLSINITIRSFLICATFLLVVIFLGFLGTFWFRTQERVDEIAIRMVNGASRRDIFRRFIGEGMLLLCISTIIAIPIELLMVHYGLLSDMMISPTEITLKSASIYQAMAITVLLMMLLIIAGIWLPARKAMNVDPAQALKDQ